MLLELAVVLISIIILVTIGAPIARRLYRRRQRANALNGKYGNMTMWAAELIDDGDREFTIAATALSDKERMEIGVIADSKEELRELTIERLEELTDDDIPEDFA